MTKIKEWIKENKAFFFFLIVAIISIYFTNREAKDASLICVDGDTFAIEEDYFRVAYIDTPEKGEPGYEEASHFTCLKLKSAFEDELILDILGMDIYERYLVDVQFKDSSTLSEQLITARLAKPYWDNTNEKIIQLYYER